MLRYYLPLFCEGLIRVLQKRHLLQHEGTFIQHRIYDIETLVELNEEHLKEMGFTAVGDRANLLGAIKGI